MWGSVIAGCAGAARGHATAVLPISKMNSRRLMGLPPYREVGRACEEYHIFGIKEYFRRLRHVGRDPHHCVGQKAKKKPPREGESERPKFVVNKKPEL
jgi:hypothetical protein